MQGDLTDPASIVRAFSGVDSVVFTAGVRTGRFARRAVTRATEYEGVLHTIQAAKSDGFRGRFVYMTSIGVRRRSLFTWGLNLWKGGTIHWRHLAEDAIRASGLDYSIVRAAFLLNRPGGQRAVVVRQVESALGFREAIARADVAEALVQAVEHPSASRATFEVAWVPGPRTTTWPELFNALKVEYKVIGVGPYEQPDEVAKKLNTEATGGWELVAALPMVYNNVGISGDSNPARIQTQARLILKRSRK